MAQGTQKYTIRGYILDSKSDESMIGATVYDKRTSQGTVTNEYGFYSITLPAGQVELTTGYVGYQPATHSFLLSRDTLLNISMSEATDLSEVTIVGNREELGVQGSQISATDLKIEQIKAVPSMFGETDVLKALQLLPGVQGGTEGTAGLLVRGGNMDENLLLLDGVPMYNVNHMFGLFSTFNPDAIKNVTLYKGSFPARFCGRLSSVVDVRMKDGDMYAYHGNFSVGFISSKINLEGPIKKGKSSFNISARRTYSDLVLNSALFLANTFTEENTEDTYLGYYFYDLNLKLTHKFSDDDHLYLSFYNGDDDIFFKFKSNDSQYKEKDKLGWHWGNLVAAVRWNHVISPKLFMDMSFNYTQYRHRLGIDVIEEDKKSDYKGNASIKMRSGIFDETLRADFHYSPASGHDMRFGSSLTHHIFRPDITTMKAHVSSTDTTYTERADLGQKSINAVEMQYYIEDNMSLGYLFKVNTGLSSSIFSVNGRSYFSLEPRLSGRLLLSDNLSAKAGYAYMTQYIHLLSNNSLSLPTDLWVPVTENIEPERSHQWALGLNYEWSNKADISLEGYYKLENNLLEYKEGVSFMTSSTDWQDKVAMGRGWSYGIEFMAQRSIGRFNGWVSYTWSHTRRKFDREGMVLNEGRPFDAKFDRRHDFSVTGSYRFSDRFDMSATWLYATGNCGTLYTQYYKPAEETEIYDDLGYAEHRNNLRLNPYHRLDLSLNWHKQLKRARRTFNVSIYNAYNNMNPFLVYVYTDGYTDDSGTWHEQRTLRQLTLFPILPTFSYTLSF